MRNIYNHHVCTFGGREERSIRKGRSEFLLPKVLNMGTLKDDRDEDKKLGGVFVLYG